LRKIKEILIDVKERLERRKSLPNSERNQVDYFIDPKDDDES
jgi:hypothetical protein